MRSGINAIFFVSIAVFVGIGSVFLINYATPIAGGERQPVSLLGGLVFYAIPVGFMLWLSQRPARRKIAIMGGTGTLLALAYVGYLALNGVRFPDQGRRALQAFVEEQGGDDFAVTYVWLGKFLADGVHGSAYCVIIDPPLADGRNAFVVEGGEVVYNSPGRTRWEQFGCGHTGDVTNPGF